MGMTFETLEWYLENENDKLLKRFVTDDTLHRKAVDHAIDKKYKLHDLDLWSNPYSWMIMGNAIMNGAYIPSTSERHYLDKENGNNISYKQMLEYKRLGKKVRELAVLPKDDRVVFNTFYQLLYDEFEHLIHEKCVSYRRKESTRTVAKKLQRKLRKMKKYFAIKIDLTKFFDTVPIEIIDALIDELMERCPSKIWKPIIDCYHDNKIIVNGKAEEQYMSLRQGNPLGCLFADLILRDIDEKMGCLDIVYYRYCDDILIVAKNRKQAEVALTKLCKMLAKKGVTINESKTERKTENDWLTFLGFRFKGDKIGPSEKTVRNIKLKVKEETVNQCAKLKRPLTDAELRKAIKNIQKYFFDSCKKCNTGMASYLYGADVLEEDIDRIDEWIKDCLRAAKLNRCLVYGLGCSNGDTSIVQYNYGQHVGGNRLMVKNEDLAKLGWYSLNFMRKKYLSGNDVYQFYINEMKNGVVCID